MILFDTIPSDVPIFKIDNTSTGLVLKKRDPVTGAFAALAWADVDPETGEWTLWTGAPQNRHVVGGIVDPDDAVSALWSWRLGIGDHHTGCECEACADVHWTDWTGWAAVLFLRPQDEAPA